MTNTRVSDPHSDAIAWISEATTLVERSPEYDAWLRDGPRHVDALLRVDMSSALIDPELLRAALHSAGIGCKPNIPECHASHRGHAIRIASAYRALPDDCRMRDA